MIRAFVGVAFALNKKLKGMRPHMIYQHTD
jgi:hypothetical protein